MCNERPWWKRPLRVIQTNLQVLDTPRMDEARIAAQIEDLGANVLVVNVGGIYAWYPTALPFHTVNPCLPKDHDLLEALLAACHARGIRVVARFDFSKASDRTYQMRPQWFARSADGSPQVVGAMRPGNWDLLYTTCINSGYRNAELAAPALREALGRYDLDGVFFNAPHAPNCHCEACKAKYLALCGAPLPEHIVLLAEKAKFSRSGLSAQELEALRGFAAARARRRREQTALPRRLWDMWALCLY